MMTTTPFILTLTGPSCAGKTTMANALKARGWMGTRSFTTRAPREGELEGVHYDFRDEVWFRLACAAGHIVEYNRHAGAVYGTTVEALERASSSGKPVVSVLDPNGVVNLRKACGTSMRMVSMFLSPSRKVALERLDQRYGIAGKVDSLMYATRLSVYLNQERYWLDDYFAHFDLIEREFSQETEDDILAVALAAAEGSLHASDRRPRKYLSGREFARGCQGKGGGSRSSGAAFYARDARGSRQSTV